MHLFVTQFSFNSLLFPALLPSIVLMKNCSKRSHFHRVTCKCGLVLWCCFLLSARKVWNLRKGARGVKLQHFQALIRGWGRAAGVLNKVEAAPRRVFLLGESAFLRLRVSSTDVCFRSPVYNPTQMNFSENISTRWRWIMRGKLRLLSHSLVALRRNWKKS